MHFIVLVIMPPPVGKGAISVAFVRLSVSLSVAYIANNSRTQKPSVPKFRRKVPHLRYDSRTSFKVKRWKVRVTRPGNADTHRASYEWQSVRTSNLVYTDGGRRSASATGAMTSKVKDQGHKVTWSVWAVLAQWLINRNRIAVVSPKLARGYPWHVLLRTSFKVKR